MMSIHKHDEAVLSILSQLDEKSPPKNNNQNIAFIGSSGSGKTVGQASVIEGIKKYEDSHGTGICCIILDEPRKGRFEFLHYAFAPEQDYHLKSLKKTGREPEPQPVKIWTPLSTHVPKSKIFEQNFFTIPMDFSEWCMRILIEPKMAEEAGMSHEMNECLNVQRDLKGMETFIDFKIKVNKSENLGEKIKKGINSAIKTFEQENILAPKSNALNLDIRAILEDTTHYHFLNLNYIESDKVRIFVKAWFLEEIFAHIKNAKHRIVLFYPEIVKDADKNALRYNKILAQEIGKKFKYFRGSGDLISDTQYYFQLHDDIRGIFTTQLYGFNDSPDDISKLIEKNYYDAEKQKLIRSLKRTEFVMKGKEDDGVFRFSMPRHKVWEEGETFDYLVKLWERYGYGMQKYDELVNSYKEMRHAEEKKWEAYLKEESKKQEKPDHTKESKLVMKYKMQLEQMKEKRGNKTEVERKKRNDEIWRLSQETDEKGKKLSMGKIATRLGISKATVHEVLTAGNRQP